MRKKGCSTSDPWEKHYLACLGQMQVKEREKRRKRKKKEGGEVEVDG